MINFKCEFCNKPFERTDSEVKKNIKNVGRKQRVCSQECRRQLQILEGNVHLNCSECEKPFVKSKSQFNKSQNHFCSSACNARYYNARRKGMRRSQWETLLNEWIKKDFPKLETKENFKLPSGLEIDILLPSLNLAIELNGPVHYLPIYGEEKLSLIEDRDIRKQVEIQTQGMNLIVLNISQLNSFSKKYKVEFEDLYLNKIKPLLR